MRLQYTTKKLFAPYKLIATTEKHIARRESLWGRWVPVVFYGLNVALWFLTGIVFEARDLLYLTVLALPALALYVWRTR